VAVLATATTKERAVDQRIVVATDGEPGALGALRLARLLERRNGSSVEVFAACDPGDFYRLPVSHAPGDPRRRPSRGALEMLRERVRSQLAQNGTERWQLTVERGAPAPAVQRLAVRRRATVILSGLTPTSPATECWVGRETVHKFVQLAPVPTLAIPATSGALPRRALLAFDFSRFSARAAWEVLPLLGSDAQLHLAHVLPEPLEDGEPWHRGPEQDDYRGEAQRRLEELAAGIRRGTDITTYLHLLSGSAAHAILALAQQLDVDLLGMGSHGHGFIGRVATGSTCSRLIRGARCSILVAPPTGVASEFVNGRQGYERSPLPHEVAYATSLVRVG
jgi:nucleotide-binding universal stress UspA family protein